MNPTYEAIETIIRSRRTTKVIAAPESPVIVSVDEARAFEQVLVASVAAAGWAPFHHDRKRDGIAEPWRVHLLRGETCRIIARKFDEWFEDIKPGNKLPGMLNACGAVLLVNWIPQSADEIPSPQKREEVNLEHVAATAAMIQNFLLLMTAGGFTTYWSSGGQLRSPTMFAKLQIPDGEQLLGAIFVEHPGSRNDPSLERVAGKLHNRRSDVNQWLRIGQIVD